MWGETSYLAMSGRDLANALEIMVGQFVLLSLLPRVCVFLCGVRLLVGEDM